MREIIPKSYRLSAETVRRIEELARWERRTRTGVVEAAVEDYHARVLRRRRRGGGGT